MQSLQRQCQSTCRRLSPPLQELFVQMLLQTNGNVCAEIKGALGAKDRGERACVQTEKESRELVEVQSIHGIKVASGMYARR